MGVYVDDLPLVASVPNYQWFCETLVQFFKLTDKGQMRRCLGIDIKQTVQNNVLTDVTLSQEKYTINILNQFGFHNSKPVYTPAAIPNTFLVSNMPNTENSITDVTTSNTDNITTVSAKSYPSLVLLSNLILNKIRNGYQRSMLL